MLNQLLEQIDSLESVESKFANINERSLKSPTTVEEILDLVKLTRYQIDDEDFPHLNLYDVVDSVKTAKQLLVETSDYFYI